MIRTSIWILVLAGLGLALTPGSAMAQANNRVGFQPSTTNVVAGQTFNLALVGKNFDRVTEGGGVNLQFNPARLRVLSVSVDSTTWEFFSQPGVIDNGAGSVTNLLFASFVGRTGDFPVASIGFQALTAGSVNVQLSESPQNPFASGGQALPVIFEPASVVVAGAPVPVPLGASAALGMLLVCVGLVAMRRRPVTSQKDLP